jgi:hypothetical protein
VSQILLTNAGSGYTVAPTIQIIGGGGTGAIATCSIETVASGIINFSITNPGYGYKEVPSVTIVGSVGSGQTAVGIASINSSEQVSTIRISNPGVGYTQSPTITIQSPSIISGFGTFIFNEIVTGTRSYTTARVKSWDKDTNMLKVSIVSIGATIKGFYPGELIVGAASSARYAVSSFEEWDEYDKYSENKTIELEADQIIDFSESNPFGTY